jgi:hypothetical protein
MIEIFCFIAILFAILKFDKMANTKKTLMEKKEK